MKIAISAESTIDLNKEILDKYQIHIVPFQVVLGERIDDDGVINGQEIFDFVKANKILPKTVAVNEYAFEEHFKKLLEEYDAVIHVSLSSQISSACNNAINASKKFENVYVIDSLSLSTGIALLAIYASNLVNEGLEAKEIYEKVKDRVNKLQVSFVVNTTEYLYKGGRCSSLARLGSLLLRIKPQIVLREGKLVPGKKYFGKSSWTVRDYVKDTLEEFNTPDLSLVFITHSHATPDMISEAQILLKSAGFKQIVETTAGATISSHCGPKTLGILYFNDGNKVISLNKKEVKEHKAIHKEKAKQGKSKK